MEIYIFIDLHFPSCLEQNFCSLSHLAYGVESLSLAEQTRTVGYMFTCHFFLSFFHLLVTAEDESQAKDIQKESHGNQRVHHNMWNSPTLYSFVVQEIIAWH